MIRTFTCPVFKQGFASLAFCLVLLLAVVLIKVQVVLIDEFLYVFSFFFPASSASLLLQRQKRLLAVWAHLYHAIAML